MKREDLSLLSKDEKSILNMIAGQLLCAVAERHEYLETEIKAVCEDEEFKAKGKTVIRDGWKSVERLTKGKLAAGNDNENKDIVLPEVNESDVLYPAAASISEHYTSPPKAFTDE